MRLRLIVALCAAALLLPFGFDFDAPSPAEAATIPRGAVRAVVVSVTDGDTIQVSIAGTVEKVRLIGIDTPEVYGGVDCYGREASARTKQLLPAGKRVWLEKDVSNRDRYGRLLRFVWTKRSDGSAYMVNNALVRGGYALVSTYPPDVKYQDRFLAAQRLARSEGKGLWSACRASATRTPAVTATRTKSPTRSPTKQVTATATPPATTPTGTLTPATFTPTGYVFPDSDVNCSDPGMTYDYANWILDQDPTDPFNLDADNDGEACESLLGASWRIAA